MKVIQLLDKFRFGGAERVALTYMSTLDGLGYQNAIFAIKDNRVSGSPVVRLVHDYLFYFKLMVSQIRKNSERTIFISHSMRSLMLSLICKLFFRKKVKIIFVQHLSYSKRHYYFLRNIGFLIDRFIQITPVVEGEFNSYFSKDKIFYFNNYILPDSYSREKGNLALKSFKAFVMNRKVVAFVGAMKKGKNCSHIIELAKVMRDSDFCFVLIGDGDEFSAVKQKVKALNLSNVFIAGYQECPLSFLEYTDFLFFSSYKNNEMMPMTILEGMSLGCKVVAYKTEVTSYLLPKENLFDFEDYLSLSKALKDDSILPVKLQYDKSYGDVKMDTLIKLVIK
ncbi:glycosyltransferase [Pseudoalteromonas sp. S1688]|uniref:glycosyltransferase n=1 Tax=Pseudoalteromonas sp. S1688 TaxID=579511 RepID=UPI00110B4642|nr:glycosyltransferase [Pseudoalteromonas sp. S1688]TMP47581.1 hypothetical protein CWB81_17870 [Pseudoalteromonas sp. S1688]